MKAYRIITNTLLNEEEYQRFKLAIDSKHFEELNEEGRSFVTSMSIEEVKNGNNVES